jgi:hypothetical protein
VLSVPVESIAGWGQVEVAWTAKHVARQLSQAECAFVIGDDRRDLDRVAGANGHEALIKRPMMEVAKGQTVARIVIVVDSPGNNMRGGNGRAALGRQQAHTCTIVSPNLQSRLPPTGGKPPPGPGPPSKT